jgi:hypothetical protein
MVKHQEYPPGQMRVFSLDLGPWQGVGGGADGGAGGGVVGQAGAMVVAVTDTAAAVARYAGRLHRVAGEGHHVASPLGAWLLLALCGPASGGRARDQLADAVGCDLDQSAAAAGALLGAPHPAVAAAAGVWQRGGVSGGPLAGWLAGLPRAVQTGQLAGQAALDDWARRSTGGMIRELPVELSPEVPRQTSEFPTSEPMQKCSRPTVRRTLAGTPMQSTTS